MDTDQKKYEDYVRRMKKIRLLSTPDLESIGEAEEYSTTLVRNFSRIGEMAAKNRGIIKGLIMPVLSSDEKLSEESRELLETFSELLVGGASFEEVDVHLSELITERLMNDDIKASENGDPDSEVILSAQKVKRDYYVISALTRYYNPNAEAVRKKAIENRNALAGYLSKERFSKLSDEAKGAALQFSLMGVLLYESNLYPMPHEHWDECMSILDTAESILADPFYREQLPDYDWETYRFRLYYYGSFLAYSMIPKDIAVRTYDYAQKAIDFLGSCTNEVILAAVNTEQEEDLRYLSSVQAGFTPAREACDAFYRAYENRDPDDYSVTGMNKNLDTPSSYLSISKLMDMELTEEDGRRYLNIERSVLDYLHRLPKTSDSYYKFVTLLTNMPIYFREAPGAMTMEEFCVKAFAAIHPPTYIHINMVAKLTECMIRHLLDTSPELFLSFPDCGDAEKVAALKERILSFAYHAALCHDLGKLFIIDTISMYGRNLLDDEFDMIKSHPSIGAKIAKEHASTKEYADVIKGHHRWYDCSKGYPSGFDTFKSPYKTIIDAVTAADCLDAATDSVGRSYSSGKTFGDFVKEVEEGSGTRYAPFLTELFAHSEVKSDIEYLLREGREKLYRETFYLLKSYGDDTK